MEGRACPLAKRGPSRDGTKGTLPIEFGLRCDRDGCPVSVQGFPGTTADPATRSSQVATLRERFSLAKGVRVGDRGMRTEARIREEVKPAGLDGIRALRGPAIRSRVEAGDVEMSLFDERDRAEITRDADPGERLRVGRNPLRAEDRARTRQELLEATEARLAPMAAATRRETRRLQGAGKIGERVGTVIGTYKMAKHFTWSIDDDGVFTYQRNDASIAAEARLDGLYGVRTRLPQSALDGPGTVRTYQRLSSVERAFRSRKTVDLKVRPVYPRTEPRVRAHVFLCRLAYSVEGHLRRNLRACAETIERPRFWYLRCGWRVHRDQTSPFHICQIAFEAVSPTPILCTSGQNRDRSIVSVQALKPLRFDDEDAEGAEARRPSVVAPAEVSAGAWAKAATKRTPGGDPVHRFRTLIGGLATRTRNPVAPRLAGAEPFPVTTRPTPLQRKAFKLLGVKP